MSCRSRAEASTSTHRGQSTQTKVSCSSRAGDGVKYTLRFGQVVYGSGDAVTVGTELSDQKKGGPAENRYMMISAEFDPAAMPEPQRPATHHFEKKSKSQWTEADKRNQKLAGEHASWEGRMTEGRNRADALAARFAKWYYVIPSESFVSLRIEREKMLEQKKQSTKPLGDDWADKGGGEETSR